MLRHLIVLLAVKIGEVCLLFGDLGLFVVSRSELGHISHLDSFLLLLPIAKHISVVLLGLQQLADLWLLLIEPLFVGVLAPLLRLEVLMLYITIIISVSAAVSLLPWCWVNAVSDVDHPVV